MKLLVLALFVLVGCSRGSGVYIGQVVDVGWEGYFMESCEVDFKTSEQASTVSKASSVDKELCTQLQSTIGKKFKVYWVHRVFKPSISSEYEITHVQELN